MTATQRKREKREARRDVVNAARSADVVAILSKELGTWLELSVLLGDFDGPMPLSTLDDLERRGLVPRALKVGKAKFFRLADYRKWVAGLGAATPAGRSTNRVAGG